MTPLARRRLLFAAPLAAAAAAGAGAFAMLRRMPDGRFDPHAVDAPALGRAVPDFSLPALAPGPGFDAVALRAQSRPVLVNFFASWCIPCLEEADALRALARRPLPVWGIAYKDPDGAAADFVRRTGHPYARLVADRDGHAAIDWGVSGVPESFLVAPGGRIVWHRAGGLRPVDLEMLAHAAA